MAIQKPSKPDVSLPENFGGIKTPYTDTQVKDGFLDGVPQVVDGGNINFEKDGVFKHLKYLKTVADALVDMPISNVLTVDSNNRFTYSIPATIASNTEYTDGTLEDKAPSVKQVRDSFKDLDGKMTNCIASAPNNIKLELNEEILTLKSGSKLYDAKGNSVTLNSDLTYTMTFTIRVFCYVLVTKESNQIILIAADNDPNLTFTENTVMYKTEECWLPFAMATRDAAGKSSINKVFNEFGAMGSTYFLLPNVKFLFANGYNDDGSVKNIEWTSDKVYLRNRVSNNGIQFWAVGYNQDTKVRAWNQYYCQDDEPSNPSSYSLWYKPSARKTYVKDQAMGNSDWNEYPAVLLCKDIDAKTEIYNFNFRTPFVAFDENDFNPRFDNRMQVVNTLPASPEKDIFYFCTNA